jgi:threonine dehydrogenase-like Zn-dependent dehydrogenase
VVETCKKLTGGYGYDVVIEITGVASIATVPCRSRPTAAGSSTRRCMTTGVTMAVPMTDTFHNRNLT